jgi:hypothetical protein
MVPFLATAAVVSGCGSSSSSVDALSEAACVSFGGEAHEVTSVLEPDDAVASALVDANVPTIVHLAGPVSYVALEVPIHHVDYGIFVRPAGSVTAISTSALPEEQGNAECPETELGQLRCHIHESDHSVLTIEGDGDVWLYFGATGGGGHGQGGEGGHGGEDGHGGHGGHGGHRGHAGEPH